MLRGVVVVQEGACIALKQRAMNCVMSRLDGRRDALAPVIGPFLVVLLVVLIVRRTRS